jgi:hypothetical protein
MSDIAVRRARRSLPWVVVVVVSAAMLGCQSDLATWQAKLAASNAPHLVGLWKVQLYLDGHSADSLGQPKAVGQIALTLNNERVGSPGFGDPPMVVGTYDVDFGPVGLATVRYAGFPGVVGRCRGDSVDLKLASESKLPIELSGVMIGDSVVGRWDAHSRAGPGGTGDFVLRRR